MGVGRWDGGPGLGTDTGTRKHQPCPNRPCPARRGSGPTCRTATPPHGPAPGRALRPNRELASPASARGADDTAPEATARGPCCPRTWAPEHLAMGRASRHVAGAGARREMGKGSGEAGWESRRLMVSVSRCSTCQGPGQNLRVRGPGARRATEGCRRAQGKWGLSESNLV